MFTLWLLVGYLFQASDAGLNCLSCADVPGATHCSEIQECGPHEVCYSSTVRSFSGHIFRRMGCRDVRQCGSNSLGKRFLNNPGDVVLCDECCDATLCQTRLCNDTGYHPDRGVICYYCQHQLQSEHCSSIIECGRDAVCYESYHPNPSGSILRETGCYGKLQCTRVMASLGGHTQNSCWNCCSDDLCNTICNPQINPVPTTVTGSSTVSPTHKVCVDATSASVCQMASSIFCKDALHAASAHCSHYCGFC